MRVEVHIRLAHLIRRKNGSTYYVARAFVRSWAGDHTRKVAIEDTQAEAERVALKYVRWEFERDGVAPPEKVENIGRIRSALLDAWVF